ncbi:hypothetical protein [Sorangium sp. So ce388]|uniref:hypothetical protein n=1 Tax=Sorangium sp. So ce388 TaxID=3133309 RepID=UPI003F5C6AA6
MMAIAARAFKWAYYRATGDVWSQAHRDIGIRPTLRWVLTGREKDAARTRPTIQEAIMEGSREAELGIVEVGRGPRPTTTAEA